MIKFLKWLFSPRCEHEVDMENLKVYSCKKCHRELSGIEYSTGGIGKSDNYFSWQLKCDFSNPNSDLSKMFANIDFDERLRIVKEKVARKKALKEQKKI